MKKLSKKFVFLFTAAGLMAASTGPLKAYGRKKHQTEKQENHPDRNDGRGVRIGGFLLGAGAGGGIAAGVGKAKWAALGAPLGGLAGYLIVRAIQRGKENRNQNKKGKDTNQAHVVDQNKNN